MPYDPTVGDITNNNQQFSSVRVDSARYIMIKYTGAVEYGTRS